MIPRFALSASEPMLEVCQALLKEDAALLFTSHINESPREIEAVAALFPVGAGLSGSLREVRSDRAAFGAGA